MVKHFGRLNRILIDNRNGSFFRNYIRMYPALVNCTTVIYFSEWSHEALIDVAHHFLIKFNFGLENHGTVRKPLFNFIKFHIFFLKDSSYIS